MILTCFKFAFHACSILEAREIVAFSSLLESERSDILMLLIVHKTSLIKLISSLLFFTIECLYETISSSEIAIKTKRGTLS